MRFHIFLKQMSGHNDKDIDAFIAFAKKAGSKFPQSSDPRMFMIGVVPKLNPQQKAGYVKSMLLYSAFPENQLPKDLKENKAEFQKYLHE